MNAGEYTKFVDEKGPEIIVQIVRGLNLLKSAIHKRKTLKEAMQSILQAHHLDKKATGYIMEEVKNIIKNY